MQELPNRNANTDDWRVEQLQNVYDVFRVLSLAFRS